MMKTKLNASNTELYLKQRSSVKAWAALWMIWLMMICCQASTQAENSPDAITSRRTSAYQDSISQEQLRLETRRQELEMLEVLSKLKRYSFTQSEHGELKQVLERLDGVAEKEMPEVVKQLREASRKQQDEEIRQWLVIASSGQKNISTELRTMADHLLLLRDQTKLRERIQRLALRQKASHRAIGQMAALATEPHKIVDSKRGHLSLVQIEQVALAKEVLILKESLDRLLQKGKGDRRAFEMARQVYLDRQLEQHAQKSSEKVQSNLREAESHGKRVYDGLLQMLVRLDVHQPQEQQLLELADEVKEIAIQQERLAQSAAKVTVEDQPSLLKDQQQLSDQIEMVKHQLQELDHEQSKLADQIQNKTEALVANLKKESLLKADLEVVKLADGQKEAAQQMRKLEQNLINKAQEMVEMDTSRPARQALALADKLSKLADQQKDLAEKSKHHEGTHKQQKEISQQQGELTKGLENKISAIERLSPEAASQTKMAHHFAQQAEQMFKNEDAWKAETQRNEVASHQLQASGQIKSASEILREKAQELSQDNVPLQPSSHDDDAESMEHLAAVNQQLASLVDQQQELSRQTQEADTADRQIQTGLQHQQRTLADAIGSLEPQIKRVSPNSTVHEVTSKAQQSAYAASQTLNENSALQDEAKKDSLLDQQRTVIEHLKKAQTNLQQQLQHQQQLTQFSQQEQTVAEAIHEVMTARSEIELAQRQIGSLASVTPAPLQNRLQQADQSFQQAQKLLEPLSVLVGEPVIHALEQGQQLVQSLDESSNNPEEYKAPLQQAMKEADMALQGLQQVAIQLAHSRSESLQAFAQTRQSAAQSSDVAGKGTNPQAQGSLGGSLESLQDDNDLSAISKLRSGQRDALELLKQEKVSPDYEAMVQQYIRNLADGLVPTK